jgi:hypothetical protein
MAASKNPKAPPAASVEAPCPPLHHHHRQVHRLHQHLGGRTAAGGASTFGNGGVAWCFRGGGERKAAGTCSEHVAVTDSRTDLEPELGGPIRRQVVAGPRNQANQGLPRRLGSPWCIRANTVLTVRQLREAAKCVSACQVGRTSDDSVWYTPPLRTCESQADRRTPATGKIRSSASRSAGVFPPRARWRRRWLYSCSPRAQFTDEFPPGGEGHASVKLILVGAMTAPDFPIGLRATGRMCVWAMPRS